jgi:hypothetical protein
MQPALSTIKSQDNPRERAEPVKRTPAKALRDTSRKNGAPVPAPRRRKPFSL